MAHGYLLSSFLSPLTNVRSDEYGRDRALFPLEVFAACRSVWPASKPMSARISRDGLGLRRVRRRRRGGVRAAPGGGGLRHRGCLHRAGLADAGAGLRAVVPDAVRGPDPPRGGHPGDRRGRDLVATTTSTRSSAPGARTSARWPARTCGTRTGRCTPPSTRASLCRGRRSTDRARASRRPARTCGGCRCGASTGGRRVSDGRRHRWQAWDRRGDLRRRSRART